MPRSSQKLHHIQHFLPARPGYRNSDRVGRNKSGARRYCPACLIPGPVGFFGIQEDDACLRIFLIGVAPDVVIAIGRIAVCAGSLEPGMLVGGVVEHQVGMTRMPRR